MGELIVATQKYFMIGLPSAGKTTFLAALWYVLESKDLQSKLALYKLNGDIEYLNLIRKTWIECEKQERTKPVDETLVRIQLINNEGQLSELIIPELSGETYKQQWLSRKWTKEFASLVNEASGALLFVHPENIINPDRIDTANRLEELIRVAGEEIPKNDDIGEGLQGVDNNNDESCGRENFEDISIDEIPEWDPELSPTQVILVDLLQYIQADRLAKKPYKIAVVISAWDLVKGIITKPQDYLEKDLPLLYQYLTSNVDDFQIKIFGVSAQGGDFETDKEQLLLYTNQSERIIVVDEISEIHDITYPISWLME